MNRFTVAFLVALLAHGLAIYGISQVRSDPAEVNVKQGRASMRMAFQAAAAAPQAQEESKKPEKKKEQQNQAQKQEESEQEKKKKEPQPEEPKEKSPSSEGVTSEPEPVKPQENREEQEIKGNGEKQEITGNEVSKENGEKEQRKQQENKGEQGIKERKQIEEIKETERKNENNNEKQQKNANDEKQAPESVNTQGVEWVESVDYQENPPPRYPTKARVLGIEGTVRLLVTIDPQGNPESVEIHEESGSYRLDEAARRAVRDWTFVPAKDNGEPVRSKTIVPVTFSLEGQ